MCRPMMRTLEAPTTLADSTKGSALSRMVSARMTRKYCGMNTTVMEMAAAKMPPQKLDCAAADDDRHDDGQQQGRESVDGVGDHHQDPVQPAAEVAADQAEGTPSEDGHRHGHDDHDGRPSGSPR